jgi:hypothetical protein
MEEALAAVGLASSIVQFIQVGAQVVCKTKENGRSARGLTKDASDVVNMTRGLQKICSDLVAKTGKPAAVLRISRSSGR